MDWFDSILSPIMWVVAWIMYLAHRFFVEILGMNSSGWSWILSIVILVVVMRIILIPLFVRQIRASRGLQIVQPEIQKLQKKYKGKTDPASRQAQQQEMMAIYREAGTNPFASCLPILAQSPIFFALFRVLYSLPQISTGARAPIGPLTAEIAAEAEASKLFGAPLSAWFLMPADLVPDGTSLTTIRIVTTILIIAMSVTTFTTQRQLTMKNMPASALDNPMARQQKMLMYLMPLIFAFSGVNFPIGVLIYWTTTNLWSMGQQFYVIRNMPAPGSEAERKFLERKARKEARKRARGGSEVLESGSGSGGASGGSGSATALLEDSKPAGGQRVQPKRNQPRAKRKGGAAAGAVAGGAAGEDDASGAAADRAGGSGDSGESGTSRGSDGLLEDVLDVVDARDESPEGGTPGSAAPDGGGSGPGGSSGKGGSGSGRPPRKRR